MRLNFLKYKTKSSLKSNETLHSSLPYKQANLIGILFTVEDKTKHEDIKDFVKRLENDGKQVKVMTFLPKNRENYEFLYDFFTDKDLNFWGSITSEAANRFTNIPFDFLFYIDTTPNPFLLNIIARSKAKCRVGKYFEEGQSFFEFLIEEKNGTKTLINSIYQYTSTLK
jgi:hypothetical protein